MMSPRHSDIQAVTHVVSKTGVCVCRYVGRQTGRKSCRHVGRLTVMEVGGLVGRSASRLESVMAGWWRVAGRVGGRTVRHTGSHDGMPVCM